MNRPKVAIIAPMYNVSEFIEEFLEGVVAQIYPNFMLVLVDDCSTDASFYMADDYLMRSEKKIDYIIARRSKNKGWAVGTNLAVNIAIGSGCEYVFIANADDIVADILLTETVEAIGDNDWLCMPIPFEGGTHQPNPSPTIPEMLEQNRMTNFCLVKSSMWHELCGYDEELNGGNGFEDWDFWIRAFKAGKKCIRLDRNLYYYRLHPNQTSRKVPASAVEAIRKKHS